MVKEALADLDLDKIDILIVENVGNLVCPAEFKVGEDYKVMILSVPEGDDKPAKYPLMFKESSVLLVNKIDLLPFLECDLERIKNEALKVNPHLKIFSLSAKTGSGLKGWCDWLVDVFKTKRDEKKG
jgi:hydrogenase nickel incorporation protein HypB